MSSEIVRAFLLWLPAGTIVPFLLSWRTGASLRLAAIEASIFALTSLVIYPTLLGLAGARFVDFQTVEVEVLFVVSFALAVATLVGFRRRLRQMEQGRFAQPPQPRTRDRGVTWPPRY